MVQSNGTQSKEKALSYNWNVYKVFKNGKRAKAPITNFKAEEENYKDYFESKIKKNFAIWNTQF